MAKHKCCGNKTKGQVLEIKLLTKTKDEYVVNFAVNSSADLSHNYGGKYLIYHSSKRNNHSLSYDIDSGMLTVFASYFASSLRQRIGHCNIDNLSEFTRIVTDTFYEKTSAKYIFDIKNTGQPIGYELISSTGQWLKHNLPVLDGGVRNAETLCKEYSVPFLRAGTSYHLFRGTTSEINEYAARVSFGGLLMNAVTALTDKPKEIKRCIALDLKRKDFIRYDAVSFVLINTSNNSINFKYGENQDKVLSIPYNGNQFYFAGWELHECGCAKGEIECTINSKKCCVNCCDVAQALYDKFSEVYG